MTHTFGSQRKVEDSGSFWLLVFGLLAVGRLAVCSRIAANGDPTAPQTASHKRVGTSGEGNECLGPKNRHELQLSISLSRHRRNLNLRESAKVSAVTKVVPRCRDWRCCGTTCEFA
jgi:hypothetical protein